VIRVSWSGPFFLWLLTLCVVDNCPAAATPLARTTEHTYDLCARGINESVDRPFTKTIRVKLTLRGAALDEQTLKQVAAEIVRSRIWPAAKVYVEVYDATDCTAAPEEPSLINIETSEAEIEAIEADLARRGPGELIASVVNLAARAAL